VDEGDLYTVCAAQAHGFKACTPEGFRYLNVAFPQATLERFRNTYLTPEDPFWREGPEPYCQRLTPAKTRTLQALINQLALAPRDQFEIDRFLLNLVHELRHPSVGGVRLSDLPDWLRQACERALAPFGPAPSVAGLVRAACRSHEHVSRTFMRCTGRTPTDFVNEVRLARAAHALSMTDQGISRIALDAGFANLGHFYRRFRAKYGVTPRRYRVMGAMGA
jgi:AraC family cel operon transcriptional repressor